MTTRMKKWQWYRECIQIEAECIKRILDYELQEVSLDDLFDSPVEQLKEIMKEVNNANN